MGKRIIVIGAGAAGLMAAAAAAGNGHSVTILEKNEKAGKKIYITGKGRCNLTNDCSTEDFFAHVARSRKFLYSAVYGFDQEQVKVFFTENGCPVKVERGNRVFPVSDHASDVTAALLRETGRKGVRILYHTAAESILAEQAGGDGLQVQGVRLKDGRTMPADAVILCTGGLSYPSTGSTGDGLVMARALGLQVTETAPSLVPFETKEMWCRELQGLALRNVAVRIFPLPKQEGGDDRREPAGEAGTEPGKDTRGESIQDARTIRKKSGRKKKKNKPVYEAFGELLFTHFGLSGPIILTASCYCDFHENPQGFRLFLDLKPALSTEQLRERLRREFSLAPNRHLPAAVRPLFPARLAEAVTMLTGLETDRRAASFTEREIAGMASLIKEIPVTITGTRGYAEAIVTRGGISVTEFNPSTMESKKVRGLYAAGEVLDVDAETGGFNLQIAWSTGHLAGSSV
ncbi:MAG: NAD(P)/FAD-dependent oxidoreductase [Eubacteriales bacterium]|nr:NAD(P)/FAD-dependent oxidoreductase [Eubacteriales bacterium]